MGIFQCLVVIACILVMGHGAPKPEEGEITERTNKDVDVEEILATTQSPDTEITPDLPDNWDQTKDDVTSLFLNRSDKTELPYPMALADDAYDGRPIREDVKPVSNTLDQIIMRPEFYGEPPSMNRNSLRRKRANVASLRSDIGTAYNSGKISPRYFAIQRKKRDSSTRNEDIRRLLSMWEAEQRRNEEENAYYSPDQDNYDGSINNYKDDEEHWFNKPYPYETTHFSHPLVDPQLYYQTKLSHYYRNSHNFPELVSPDPLYLQNIDLIRRKRQWPGLDYIDNRYSKRFMVAKKNTDDKYFRPREDMYFFNDMLKSSEINYNDPYTFPVKRRMS